jgi:ethanolamine utilization protein EutP (predicted NTPase)
MNYSAIRNKKRIGVLSKTNLKSEDKLVHYLKKKEKQYFKAHLKEVPGKIASLDYKIIKELNNFLRLKSAYRKTPSN